MIVTDTPCTHPHTHVPTHRPHTHNRTPSCRESHGDLDVEEGVDAPDLILKIHGKKKVKKMRIDSEGEEETDSEQDDDDDDDEEEEVWSCACVPTTDCLCCGPAVHLCTVELIG